MINIGKESESIEFKESTTEIDKACRAIVAMLNKSGHGTIYFGVKDNGDIIGQIVGNKTLSDIADKINSGIKPAIYPSIIEQKAGDRSIIKVDFIGSNKPYSYKGVFYIRMGDENIMMDPQLVLQGMKDSNQYNEMWENELTEYTENDINENSLEDYYVNAVTYKRLNEFSHTSKDLLIHLNLLKKDKLTNAGYYLFGKHPQIVYKAVEYPTIERLDPIDLKRFEGNIYYLIKEVLRFISERMRWKVEIVKAKRKEIPEVPIEAIREIVINSLIHADFNDSTENQITIDPEKIEIYNPGLFLDGLTPDDYIENELPSRTRHKVMQSVLYRSFDIETMGRGLKRMNNICKENNIEWTYKKYLSGVSIIFNRNTFITNNKDINSKEKMDLTHSAKSLLVKITEQNGVLSTVGEAMSLINLKERATSNAIAELVDKGYIERIGNSRNGYWKIKE